MRKAPEAFRTISEAADLLETPAHVLRFWESRFPQIKPVKRAGGRRYYRPVDIDLLSGIKKLLHDQGMTIRGVQKLLQEKGPRHVAELAPISDGLGEESEIIEAVVVPFAPIAAEGQELPPEPALPEPEPPSTKTVPPAPDETQEHAPHKLPDDGPTNAFAGLGATPAPEGPLQRAPARPAPSPRLPAPEAGRIAHMLRLRDQMLPRSPQLLAANLRLEALLARLSDAEARDSARR